MASSKEPEKTVTTESFGENVSVGKSGLAKKDDDVVAATAADDSSSMVLDSERRVAEERRLVRKLDMRLMPIIILIFIMNYIDVSALFSLLLISGAFNVNIIANFSEDRGDDG